MAQAGGSRLGTRAARLPRADPLVCDGGKAQVFAYQAGLVLRPGLPVLLWPGDPPVSVPL